MKKKIIKLSIFLVLFATSCQTSKQEKPTQEAPNFIIVTLDGVRWQEVFRGIDQALLENKKFTKNPAKLIEKFYDSLETNSRKKVMPFFWSEIEKKGQIYGDPALSSSFQLTNKRIFSYPGYNEILTGEADDSIDSNAKIYNKNKTILEALNEDQRYKNKVAAFASWDVFPYIINDKRSGVEVNAGYMPVKGTELSFIENFVNEYQDKAPILGESWRFDLFTYLIAMEHLKKNKPKAIFVGFDETDEFAHYGSYDTYIKSLHYTDAFIKSMWEYVNSDPFYKDNTYLIITTDHGRGNGAEEDSMWTSHGINVRGAEMTWLAVLGPNLNPLGNLKNSNASTNQIAPTIAKLAKIKFDAQSSEINTIR